MCVLTPLSAVVTFAGNNGLRCYVICSLSSLSRNLFLLNSLHLSNHISDIPIKIVDLIWYLRILQLNVMIMLLLVVVK